MYRYKAKVTSVYDGDTCTVDIDLGFFITLRDIKIRLYGINTPELKGGTEETKLAGRNAKDFVKDLILDKDIILESQGQEKYGRWLGTIYIVERETGTETCLNSLLIEKGLAISYMI